MAIIRICVLDLRMHRSQPATPESLDYDRPNPVCEEDEALGASPLHSASILRGRNSVTIDHEGTRYTLRTTRAGKLILTK